VNTNAPLRREVEWNVAPHEKLRLDWSRGVVLCASEEARMDQETIELARQLCCQAGMIMEDFNPIAVAPPTGGEELVATVAALSAAVQRMRALLSAADALMR
jgi:hypothetical protein